LPTGSGKTRVAIAAIAAVGGAALCIVPTRALLDQWRDAIAATASLRVGCLGDGRSELEAVTVATYESALRHMHRIGACFQLLVVDEAHHFASGARDELLQMSIAPARLGLTATPPETEEPRQRLTQLLGPIVIQKNISDLAGSAHLAGFDRVLCRLQLTARERGEYERAVEPFNRLLSDFRRGPGRNARVRFSDIVCFAMSSAEGRAALAGWRRAKALLADTEGKRQALGKLLRQHRHARVLVFTADNDSAYGIARRELITPITCNIGRAERTAAIAAFASGRLRALVSSRVLNEGVDVPDADIAIIVGSTSGEREYVQRLGRLLRPVPGKRARIYELVTEDTTEVAQALKRARSIGKGATAMTREVCDVA